MPKRSAGLLLWRRAGLAIEVLIGHPGGPFFKRKDAGIWSIPKGEYDLTEEPIEAAKREFAEETGAAPPEGPYLPLGETTQRSGKIVAAWAVRADFNPANLSSNLTTQGWPEIDRVEWVSIELARERLIPGQSEFLDRLLLHVEVTDV